MGASRRRRARRTGRILPGLLELVEEVPFRTATDSLLIDVIAARTKRPWKSSARLRTRLNHMKSLQPIHSMVVTSASPAEGKSLSAANLALAQAHLAGNTTLLADFDFRRPIVHTLFGIDRSPGITDYLLGKVPLHKAIRKIAGTNLYIMPAGEAVINPLELLNLRGSQAPDGPAAVAVQLDHSGQPAAAVRGRRQPAWARCATARLLVVRIGHTTIDSVTRAMQSLCNNNVLGIVVNGARRGELYSKYTYYHSYYTPKEDGRTPESGGRESRSGSRTQAHAADQARDHTD